MKLAKRFSQYMCIFLMTGLTPSYGAVLEKLPENEWNDHITLTQLTGGNSLKLETIANILGNNMFWYRLTRNRANTVYPKRIPLSTMRPDSITPADLRRTSIGTQTSEELRLKNKISNDMRQYSKSQIKEEAVLTGLGADQRDLQLRESPDNDNITLVDLCRTSIGTQTIDSRKISLGTQTSEELRLNSKISNDMWQYSKSQIKEETALTSLGADQQDLQLRESPDNDNITLVDLCRTSIGTQTIDFWKISVGTQTSEELPNSKISNDRGQCSKSQIREETVLTNLGADQQDLQPTEAPNKGGNTKIIDIEEYYNKTCEQIIKIWNNLAPEEQVQVYRKKGTTLWPMLNGEQQRLLRNSLLGINKSNNNGQISEQQKERSEENTYKKDSSGNVLYRDGSYMQPDGTIIYCNGSWKTPDGITHYPDTSWKDQYGNLYPPHSYKDANGSICYNDGCWKDTKGLMHYRDGRIIKCSDGKLLRNKDPKGNKYYHDGSWEDSYGVKHYPNDIG